MSLLPTEEEERFNKIFFEVSQMDPKLNINNLRLFARKIIFSQTDPGHFTPRGDNFNEPLDKWRDRALEIVLNNFMNG